MIQTGETVIRDTNPSKVTTRRRTSLLQSTDTLSRLSLITCYDSGGATDLPMAVSAAFISTAPRTGVKRKRFMGTTEEGQDEMLQAA